MNAIDDFLSLRRTGITETGSIMSDLFFIDTGSAGYGRACQNSIKTMQYSRCFHHVINLIIPIYEPRRQYIAILQTTFDMEFQR